MALCPVISGDLKLRLRIDGVHAFTVWYLGTGTVSPPFANFP
jgi:hypothetical protein